MNQQSFHVAFNPRDLNDAQVSEQFCNYFQDFFGLATPEDVKACGPVIQQYITAERVAVTGGN